MGFINQLITGGHHLAWSIRDTIAPSTPWVPPLPPSPADRSRSVPKPTARPARSPRRRSFLRRRLCRSAPGHLAETLKPWVFCHDDFFLESWCGWYPGNEPQEKGWDLTSWYKVDLCTVQCLIHNLYYFTAYNPWMNGKPCVEGLTWVTDTSAAKPFGIWKKQEHQSHG